MPMDGETGEGNALGDPLPRCGHWQGRTRRCRSCGLGGTQLCGSSLQLNTSAVVFCIKDAGCPLLPHGCPMPAPQPACCHVIGKSPFLPPQLLGVFFFFLFLWKEQCLRAREAVQLQAGFPLQRNQLLRFPQGLSLWDAGSGWQWISTPSIGTLWKFGLFFFFFLSLVGLCISDSV